MSAKLVIASKSGIRIITDLFISKD